MGKKKVFSPTRRAQIVEMREQEKSYVDIYCLLHKAKAHVHAHLYTAVPCCEARLLNQSE